MLDYNYVAQHNNYSYIHVVYEENTIQNEYSHETIIGECLIMVHVIVNA